MPDFVSCSDNQNLQDLQAHLQDVFTSPYDNDVIKNSLELKIHSKVLRDLICWNVWNSKGKLEGIHPDFGFLSYTRSPKISGHYHINDDDRVNLLLNISERFSRL